MDLKEIEFSTRNWVDSAQDRDYWRALVNATLNLRVPAMELVSCLVKPTGKRNLGRSRRRWEDNIRMNLKEIGIITRNEVDSVHKPLGY